MTSREWLHSLTTEQRRICYKNKKKAREYFGINGNNNLVLHHKNTDWRYNDVDRYIQWNPDDLMVLTRKEHPSYHKPSEDTRAKMSIAQMGKHHGNVAGYTQDKRTKFHWKNIDGRRVYF